jgi:hypothetical protein
MVVVMQVSCSKNFNPNRCDDNNIAVDITKEVAFNPQTVDVNGCFGLKQDTRGCDASLSRSSVAMLSVRRPT